MFLRTIVAIMVLFVSLSTFADSSCPELYPNGKVIVVQNTTELCNREFVAVYSVDKHANIFSAERFNSMHEHLARTNDFHPDTRIPKGHRAERSDYIRSGYDQGHMAPAADQSDNTEMTESFLLSNMTPQEPTLNRNTWRMMEEHVRLTAKGETYVLTGAIYSEHPKVIGANSIPVPDSYYKCAWYSQTVVECFTAENQPNATINQTELHNIETLTGYVLH